ncbi:protein of unknown function [Methylococcus capsulatus]|uniref:Uncharacterized protein n=1 Tax=Methylococcus capsulatus TaxID=414 RepID=A0AA35V192_METCP|nr:protein of unknown function [Methylococcus capsulatus]
MRMDSRRDPPVAWRVLGDSDRLGCLMVFDFAALYADVFFELALERVESVAQCDVDVLMSLFVVMFATDYQMFVRHGQVDAHMVEITLVLMMVLGFHGNPAADDMVAELLQLASFFANPGLHRVGVRNATKCNLQRYLHNRSR